MAVDSSAVSSPVTSPVTTEPDPPLNATERKMLLTLRTCFESRTFRRGLAQIIGNYPDLLAVEPMYTKQVATRLLAMSEAQMDYWLVKLKIPRRYRIYTTARRRYRMLYACELQLMRKAALRGDWNYAEQVLTGR